MDSMAEILADYAKKQPDKLLVADYRGNEFSYAEAWLNVRRVAEFLAVKEGITQGQKILVDCCQDCYYFLADLACNLIGAVFIPVEENASLETIKSICDETGAVVFFTDKDNVRFMRCIRFSEAFSFEKGNYLPSFQKKNAMAEILYTTGTTGKSKGIILTNEANLALAENIKYGVKMKPGNVELIPVPISHSHGIRCCYANLLNGGTIILSNGLLNLKKVFELIDKYSVTAMDLSPSAAQLMVKISKGTFWEYGIRFDYIQVGTAILSEQLKEVLVQNLPGVRLYNFYGSTESGRTCVLEFSRFFGKSNCIGKPTKNSEIVFTDEQRNIIDATRDNPGLLASKGKMNMSGYLGNQELTDITMFDGFVFTNDVGYIDAEGYVYILGRNDDVINYNGIKIAPDEIEQVALRYPHIKDSACVPIVDEIAGQVPKLFICVDDKTTFSMKDFNSFLQIRLDASKIPKRIEIIDIIPRTTNGKIKRKELSAE